MAQFVFPAVLYKDGDRAGYTIVLHDIDVFTEGATVEEAFLRAKEFLLTYCQCALDYNGEVPMATSFADVNEGINIKILVDAELEAGEYKAKRAVFSLD
ncbi:MAG: type II toxin-antitoxin system HicB family antitoxin [Firmicutes bacterium]|nr:type II toxin-antitoxin system HicB family antitoxin [Bacillota bacterium]